MTAKLAIALYAVIVILLAVLVKWEYRRARQNRRTRVSALAEGFSRGSK